MKKAIFAVLVLLTLFSVSAGGPPLLKEGESAVLFEGFEAKTKFYAPKWENTDGADSCQPSKDWASEGVMSLACVIKQTKRGVSTFSIDGFRPSSWKQYKAVGFDIKNATAKDILVVIGFQDAATWTWSESGTVLVKAGEIAKDIRFEISGKTFGKSYETYEAAKAGKIARNEKVVGLNGIGRFNLRYYGEPGQSGTVSLDNIRLVK